FFFQAEDGIRDFHVTGVQTCALPISTRRNSASKPTPNSVRERRASDRPEGSPALSIPRAGLPTKARISMSFRLGIRAFPFPPPRSEERRVGKGVDVGGRRSMTTRYDE